ncbi:ELO family, partial [Talaromyces proteolyticus]
NFKFPLLVSSIYVGLTMLLMIRNTKRGNTPWRISKTPLFFWFNVTHNMILTGYSAISFFGFANVVWFVFTAAWDTRNPEGRLTRMLDHGNAPELYHIWANGLVLYGFFFYMSKIYELVDTVILIVKGKTPTVFQIYHHTGALICVWAGYYYMATPLWSFIFMNCGIHTLMYTYYTVALFKFPIPRGFKMILTTMQIVQTGLAIVYGTVSLFISYNVIGEDVAKGGADLANPRIETISCVNTPGERFAISLNVAYLIPLLLLFLNFFRRTY